jgi:hypothetical protein
VKRRSGGGGGARSGISPPVAEGTDLRGELEAELAGWFRQPETPIPDEAFQRLALGIFALQYHGNGAYRSFCRGRGRTPDDVERWEDIPLVPATAFKHLDLYSATGEPEVVFRTSGTSRGGGLRGCHPVASRALYRDACVPWFALNLVPEGGRLPVLSLVPGPEQAPDSSLTTMMAFATEALGTDTSGFFSSPDSGVDAPAFRDALSRAEAEDHPVLVMGTAFGWVHWLEACAREGWRFRLPEGSRLMETGGFKGRSRAVPREQLYRELEEGLGIPIRRMVNEYGMTELLSQLYEPVLRNPGAGAVAPGDRPHVPPPWLRVRVLDPETLTPCTAGQRGLLAFFDAANLGSVSAVLTEDVGWVDDAGLHVEGRAAGAEPRGCSLAMEELLGGSP